MLSLDGVEVVYNRVALVLKGISFQAPEGSIVALLGGNGAGKTTTLKTISGLLGTERGEVVRGQVNWGGKDLRGLGPSEIVDLGIVQVLEGRHVFEHFTVEENLLVGGYSLGPISKSRAELDRIFKFFPQLEALRKRKAGYLSGGEQQMVAIGRALMARPRLMLLDEPSLGLAPVRVAEIFEIIKQVNEEEGVTFVIVEQNAEAALAISSFGYVIEGGRVALDGTAEELRENEDVSEFYLGLSGVGERKSYRQIKSYRRRKRWLG